MAAIHVYVRVQASGDNATIAAIEDAAKVLQCAVEAAGAEWKGGITATYDTPEPEAGSADQVPADQPVE